MATNSIIGKVLDGTGKCKVIYCHSDGYIEKPGVGWTLQKYYQNEKDVDKLLELGDLSFLGEVPEDDPVLWSDSYHSNKCRTYKGRGDENVDASIFKSPRIAREEIGEVYNYFYLDSKWYCLKDDEIIDLETGENVKKDKKVECLKSLKEEFYPELKIRDKVTIQGLGEDSPWEGLSGEVIWIDEEAFGDEFQTITVRVEFPTADGYREVDQNFDRKNIKKVEGEEVEEKLEEKKIETIEMPHEEYTSVEDIIRINNELDQKAKDGKLIGLRKEKNMLMLSEPAINGIWTLFLNDKGGIVKITLW
jgi:hypothetical protein